jgi:hypothetical protein
MSRIWLAANAQSVRLHDGVGVDVGGASNFRNVRVAKLQVGLSDVSVLIRRDSARTPTNGFGRNRTGGRGAARIAIRCN